MRSLGLQATKVGDSIVGLARVCCENGRSVDVADVKKQARELFLTEDNVLNASENLDFRQKGSYPQDVVPWNLVTAILCPDRLVLTIQAESEGAEGCCCVVGDVPLVNLQKVCFGELAKNSSGQWNVEVKDDSRINKRGYRRSSWNCCLESGQKIASHQEYRSSIFAAPPVFTGQKSENFLRLSIACYGEFPACNQIILILCFVDLYLLAPLNFMLESELQNFENSRP
jgi:hypothetical protein